MKKREALFTTLFRHWIYANPMESAVFELKQTTTDSLPFRVVKEHQIDGLWCAYTNALLYKAPDDSRGIKPFDLFYMHRVRAYVVIKYSNFFCLITIFNFKAEKELSKRKSLTSSRAREIASIVVEL